MLNNENYFSVENNLKYMSVSQLKIALPPLMRRLQEIMSEKKQLRYL